MKPAFNTFFLFASLVCILPAADFEVTVDGKKHFFSEGVEQKISTTEGRSVTVTVRGVKVKEFKGHGVSFSYPAEMQIEKEELLPGVHHISLEAVDSTLLMIQVYPAGTAPEDVGRELLDAFKGQFAALGAKFPAKEAAKCKRNFGAEEVEGTELSYSLGELAHKCQIYVVKKNGRTFAFTFQWAEEDAGKASPRYEVLTKSVKFLPEESVKDKGKDSDAVE